MNFYDGSTSDDEVLANYNYRSALDDVVSSTPHMIVRMRTDGSITHRGFRMRITSEVHQGPGMKKESRNLLRILQGLPP